MAIKLDHLALLPARLDKILRYNKLSTNLLLRPIQVAYDSVWKLYLLDGLHYLINSWPCILHDHIFFDSKLFCCTSRVLALCHEFMFQNKCLAQIFFFSCQSHVHALHSQSLPNPTLKRTNQPYILAW